MFSLQDFLHGNLSSLINRHILQDPDSPLGDAILEVGRIDTYLTKASLNQLDLPVTDKAVIIPAKEGSFLCRIIQETDNIDLEFITIEIINVSYPIYMLVISWIDVDGICYGEGKGRLGDPILSLP